MIKGIEETLRSKETHVILNNELSMVCVRHKRIEEIGAIERVNCMRDSV